MALTKIELNEVTCNPFTKIGEQWLLISAGTEEKFNTMTANWGGLGMLWGTPSATAYIRHSRYTKEFVDSNPCFTMTFLKDGYKKELGVLGSKSGREIDKMNNSGLTPIFVDGMPTFEEAETVFVVRKQYVGDLARENFLDEKVDDRWYQDKDYHQIYIGEVIACYKNI